MWLRNKIFTLSGKRYKMQDGEGGETPCNVKFE